jgi:putative membrane protein
MKVSRFFSASDRAAIEAAVQAAERRTAGEIVPYAVSRSDAYPEAPWLGAFLGSISGAAAAAAVIQLGDLWLATPATWAAAAAVAGGGLGYLAVFLVPPLRRMLTSHGQREHAVHRRAAEAFVEHEVFATSKRTGILIFLSLFERRVVVLADSGINDKVPQGEWAGIAASIATGVRGGKPGEALAAGIGRCADLLVQHDLTPRPGGRDELPDTLELGDEP